MRAAWTSNRPSPHPAAEVAVDLRRDAMSVDLPVVPVVVEKHAPEVVVHRDPQLLRDRTQRVDGPRPVVAERAEALGGSTQRVVPGDELVDRERRLRQPGPIRVLVRLGQLAVARDRDHPGGWVAGQDRPGDVDRGQARAEDARRSRHPGCRRGPRAARDPRSAAGRRRVARAQPVAPASRGPSRARRRRRSPARPSPGRRRDARPRGHAPDRPSCARVGASRSTRRSLRRAPTAGTGRSRPAARTHPRAGPPSARSAAGSSGSAVMTNTRDVEAMPRVAGRDAIPRPSSGRGSTITISRRSSPVCSSRIAVSAPAALPPTITTRI